MSSDSTATIEVMKMHENAVPPTRAHEKDAGLDLYALRSDFMLSGQGIIVPTGIGLAIPQGFVGMLADRSSLAKKGLKIAGGIIDSGYTGEIQVIMWNVSDQSIAIHKGDRIAQILVLPIATPAVIETLILPASHRGKGGFGSSGA